MNTNKLLFISGIILIGGYSVYSFWGGNNNVDYSTEVKPILNKHCISCHGGVKKQGGFSLLFREEALERLNQENLPLFQAMPNILSLLFV
jgi:hypothetical protein